MFRKLGVLCLCFLLFNLLAPPLSGQAVNTSESTGAKVVVFVVGMTGSEYYFDGDEVERSEWPDSANAKEFEYHFDTDPLGIKGWNSSQTPLWPYNVYSDLQDYLQGQGYHVAPFVYNWKNEIAENAALLKQHITEVKATYGVSKVDVVAHSIGGLVAAKHILDTRSNSSIGRFITIGTPFDGIPKLFYAMLSGEDSRLTRETLSAYSLLPNQDYFTKYTTSYVGETNGGVLHRWDYARTRQTINEWFDYEERLYEDAETLQQQLASQQLGRYVTFYRVIGDGTATPNFVLAEEYSRNATSGQRWVIGDMSGDGTVPLIGAKPGAERTWYVEQNHVDLVNDPNVLRSIHQILSGNEHSVSLRKNHKKSSSLKFTFYSESDSFRQLADALAEPISEQIRPTLDLMYPDGTHFIMERGEILSNPHGIDVRNLGTTIELVVDPGNYTLRFSRADAEGTTAPTGLILSQINADVSGERFDYRGVDLAAGQLLVNVSENLAASSVGYDATMDGRSDQVITPVRLEPIQQSVNLVLDEQSTSPGDSGDLPPGEDPGTGEIEIKLSGMKGYNNWFKGPVTIEALTTITIPEEQDGEEDTADSTDGEPRENQPKLFLSIDNGEEVPVNGLFLYLTDGKHMVTVYAKDDEGQVLGQASRNFKIDSNIPYLQIQVAGRLGDNGWLTSDVEVSVGATDDTSLLMQVQSKIDAARLKAYERPLQVQSEGIHSIYSDAEDNAGNVAVQQHTFKIDKTKPVISNVYLQDEYYWDQEFPIQFSVTDEISQIEYVQATINGKQVTNGQTYRFTEPGMHTYRIEVRDYAGWTSVYEETFEVFIPVTFTFAPDHLQLEHGSGMATSFVELPPVFVPEKIDFATVQLNGQIVHVQDPAYGYVKNPIGDENENGISEMMFKYERESLINVISPRTSIPDLAVSSEPAKWSDSKLTIFGRWEGYHFKGYEDIVVWNTRYLPPPPDTDPPNFEPKPSDGEFQVPVRVTPLLTASELVTAVDGQEITDAKLSEMITFTDSTRHDVPFTANWLKNSRTIAIQPQIELDGEQVYVITVPEYVLMDKSGNPNAEFRTSFRTMQNPIVIASPLPLPILEPEDSTSDPETNNPPPQEGDSPSHVPSVPEPSEANNPSVVGSVSDAVLNRAIQMAQSTGYVLLQSDSSQQVAINLGQMQTLQNIGLPLHLQFAQAVFVLPSNALEGMVDSAGQAGYVLFSAIQESNETRKQMEMKAAEQPSVFLLGEAYHFNAALLVNGEVQTVPLPHAVRVIVPVPALAHVSATNGSLRIGRLNEMIHKWELIDGQYDEVTRTFAFETDRFSLWALMVPRQSRFYDVQGHWAQAEIGDMQAAGFVKGMGDGRFAPNELVTRAQFATMLVNLLDLRAETVQPFNDVSDDEWYASAVRRAFAAGLIQGVGEGQFEPNEQITREQMAVMIERAIIRIGQANEAPSEERLQSFSDESSISPWARLSMAQLVKYGILQGILDQNRHLLAPQMKANRAEATVMLRKMLELYR